MGADNHGTMSTQDKLIEMAANQLILQSPSDFEPYAHFAATIIYGGTLDKEGPVNQHSTILKKIKAAFHRVQMEHWESTIYDKWEEDDDDIPF